MNDSIQLTILKAMTTHLQGIVPANGYDFDMSISVRRGRLLYGDTDPLPLISIVEHLQGDISTAVAGEEGIDRSETWVLLVQGWTENHPLNPTDTAYALKAATEHRLARAIKRNNYGDPEFPNEYYFGLASLKVITGLTIGPGIVSPPRQGLSEKAFFYLPLGGSCIGTSS
jgi:hypothetical protein